VKRGVKRETGIKLERVKSEKDIKPEPPTAAKRPRSVSSELSTAKRPSIVIRRQARVLEEVATEEEQKNTLKELLTLEQLLESAKGSGGEDPTAR
jgi:hypothetical protein